jgi:hypothetical protein
MTASGSLFSSGHRFATVFALDPTTGLIAPPTADTAYYGADVHGSQSFSGNFPEPRKISHTGQDRVLQVDWLPPLEGMDAQIQASVTDYDLIAALTGVKVATVGTSKLIYLLTNHQGQEPSVGQQALDLTLGIRRWQSYLFPSAKCVFMPASMTDGPSNISFKIVPAISSKTLTGQTLSESTNGAVNAQMGMMMTEGLPSVVAWKAGGAATDYTLGSGRDALNATTAWQVVTLNGAIITPSAYTTTKISVAAPHTAGDIVIAVYETIANP